MGRASGFQYKLSPTAPLENSFIKNKYFDFHLCLEGPALDPAEIVPLRIGFYTSEVPPKLITQNINFTKFLKGYCESILSYNPKQAVHDAYFRIAATEVTSHFRNNWIFMAISPKNNETDGVSNDIEPFIIDHVTIKAKKVSKSESKMDVEEEPISAEVKDEQVFNQDEG